MNDDGGTHAHKTSALVVQEKKRTKKKHSHTEKLCDWTKPTFQTKT